MLYNYSIFATYDSLTYNLLTMKKLFAVLMAAGLVGFIACSSPAPEGEAADDATAVMDEMEANMEEATEETEMAEEAMEEEAMEATEEGAEEAMEESAEEAEETMEESGSEEAAN